ncbi:MAG TPA: carboxylating nicotinate-nucleotide diphosphorylase [Pyrinomonadaceae bacterium]|nr:carboxylating nicotinate-nucleotide diphosphorylase [Pyrinomonadaceae bacterium]
MSISTPAFKSSKENNEALLRLDLDDEILATIRKALAEDIGVGDVTTNLLVAPEASAVARIIAKQDGFVSGLSIAQAVFLMLDVDMRFSLNAGDRAEVTSGQLLLESKGSARAILTGERTALNFLGRMSGIATLTRKFVKAVAGTKATILDTRKTAPGLRAIDKLAVQHGGGSNHRFGLYDMILIKDNHIDSAGSISDAIRVVKAADNQLEVEVEARNIKEVQEALDLGVKRILLDNMSLAEMRDAVAINDGRAKFEASGSVTLQNVREIAETGVDFISVGALTHSAPAFDVSLRWVR